MLLCLARASEARSLSASLRSAGCQVRTIEPPFEWPDLLADAATDVVLTEAEEMREGLCEIAASLSAAPALVLLAGFSSARDAVEAVRRGAAQFLERPQTPEQVAVAVERAASARALELENRRLRRDLLERFSLGGLVSRDPALARVAEVVAAVADTRATVLLSGESGTGKTLLARAIHLASARRDQPFVELSCGALPASLLESELFGHAKGAFTGALREHAGRFEAADGGTLFLDEIATAGLDLQVKLLRAIQDRAFERVGESATRTVDVRVIAASNCDLEAEVRAGRFREDLYWRLNVIHLRLPPLRERRGDVPLLAEHFLERFAKQHARSAAAFSPAAIAALCAHAWPGNVRELENTIERAVLLARAATLTPADLGFAPEAAAGPGALAPLAGQPGGAGSSVVGADPLPGGGPPPTGALPRRDGAPQPLRAALELPERELVVRALELAGGHRLRAAALLGVTRGTLFNKMRKYGLLGAGHGSARPGQPRRKSAG